MARLNLPSALAAAVTFALSLPPVFAQSPAASPSAPPAASTESPASATPPAPKRNRAISGDVAHMLSQTMPKFTPPPPAPPPPTAAEIAQKKVDEAAAAAAAEADLRDSDKPKNGIVRLPKYVVQEQRPVIFTERDINTKKGLRELAMRRYISDADRALNRFSLPLFAGWSPGSGNGSSTEQRALSMYAEDERLKNMADLADNANMIMRSDSAAGATAKDVVQKTYMRSSQFGYGGMAPK